MHCIAFDRSLRPAPWVALNMMMRRPSLASRPARAYQHFTIMSSTGVSGLRREIRSHYDNNIN
jgi:hypothetical protein